MTVMLRLIIYNHHAQINNKLAQCTRDDLNKWYTMRRDDLEAWHPECTSWPLVIQALNDNQRYTQVNPLCFAAFAHNYYAIQRLRQRGAQLLDYALHYALRNPTSGPLTQRKTVCTLCGYLIQQNPHALRAVDQTQRTALDIAAEVQDTMVVELLLDRGAPMDNVQPLVAAAVRGRLMTCALLLQRGMNIDARTSTGSTVLYDAVGDGKDLSAARLAGIKWLLEHGAQSQVSMAGCDGNTPLQRLRNSPHAGELYQELIELLRSKNP